MKREYAVITDERKAKLLKEEICEELKDDEVLIECLYSMISAGTELSRFAGIKKTYPFLPGYCAVGKVLKKGKAITDLKVNDLVFYNAPHASHSVWSRNDLTQGKQILKLNKKLNPMYATIINLGLVAIQGVNLSDVKVNDLVVVFGLGNIGLITALLYKKMGCKVIGIDPVKHRRDLARNLKIKTDDDYTKYINKADIAVDVTGLSPAIINAVEVTKPYGQTILLGSPRQSYETNITPLLSNIHMKNLKVIGAFNNTCPVYPKEGSDNSVIKNFERISELIINKDIDVSKFISQIIKPKDIQKAYTGLLDHKDKYNCVIIDWSK